MSLIGELRYFGKTGISSDGCFSSLVACRAKSFEFLNIPCYLWHLHGDSLSGKTKTVNKLIEEASVWNTFFTYIRETFPSVRVPEPILDHYFEYRKVIRSLYKLGERGIAIAQQKEAKI